ncbi:MAG: FCD domain-containing protein [Nocardioides sp.]
MPKLSVLTPASAGGTRAAEVVARLKEAMFLGIVSPGEQLPTEVDLARQFGVAPMTIREALSALRDMGLVETRRGRTGGSFVRRQAQLMTDESLAHLQELSISQLRDLMDEAEAVDGQSARLAARRASSANLARLRDLVDSLINADNVADRVRADSRFHIELAVAAHSERLTRAAVRIQAELSSMLWLDLCEGPDVKLVAGAHRAIAEAVAAGEEDLARDLAEQHSRSAMARLVDLHLIATRES